VPYSLCIGSGPAVFTQAKIKGKKKKNVKQIKEKEGIDG